MSLGQNISFLRKQKKMTQEQFAERMNVTRQTVSRWESDEITPELSKLIDVSEFFACSLDALVKENLSRKEDIYSEVQVKTIPAFRYVSYAIISREPESDALGYMQRWAEDKGFKTNAEEIKFIGWDFPFVSQEQQTRFGMHGYVAACVLPDNFAAEDDSACISENLEAEYAYVTIKEPFIQPFERIPNAYKLIMDYLQANNFKEKMQDNVIGCFEREYEKNGVTYMDVYVHAASVTKTDAFSSFS